MPQQPHVPEQEHGEPYPLPELTPQEVAELEAKTVERVATVRDERSLAIANLGNDKLPHFLASQEGIERCGTDGETWPCRAWTEQIQPLQVAESEGLPQGDVYTAGEIAAAEALGVTAAEIRRRMAER